MNIKVGDKVALLGTCRAYLVVAVYDLSVGVIPLDDMGNAVRVDNQVEVLIVTMESIA